MFQNLVILNKFKLLFYSFVRNYPALPFLFKWLFISSIIGISVGSASALFLQSLDYVTNYRESNSWLIAFLPIGGFLIGCLYFYWGKTVEAGNNLLIDTIHRPKDIIPFRMAPFVYIGTLVTHLLGGSAGREGTALQMAGAICDQFSKVLKLIESERKILIIAAIAAGFGAVFGTPLAGAIFGLEVFLVGKIKYEAIFPAFMAGILADLTTKSWHVPHTHYHIDYIPSLDSKTIFYVIVAGIIFGICAAIFSRAIHFVGSIFKSKISYPPFRPLIGGTIVVLAIFTLGTTKYIGLGIPIIISSFQQQLPAYDFALKIVFTIVTLAAGFKGGEVTPLFFIGATLGNALSYFIPLPIALLAGMGFVSVFAGATNTPLASSIMAMELFGKECGVFVAIACVVAYLFSGHNTIYRKQVLGVAKHQNFEHQEGKLFEDI